MAETTGHGGFAMEAQDLLAALGHIGRLAQEVETLTKQRDDALKLRDVLRHIQTELSALVEGEPEATRQEDLIAVVKAVFARQKRALTELNGAPTDLGSRPVAH